MPLVYLVDSSGVFLPMQDEVFPDEDDFGRIFRNNAVLSAQGIPQYAAIMGNCVAGGAYLPVLCDTVLMTEGSGLYLAGPALVKAAIGQDISHEELGGAHVHAAYQRHDRLSRARRRLLPRPPAPPDRAAARRPRARVDAAAIDAAGPARRGSLPRRPHRALGPVRRARPAGLRCSTAAGSTSIAPSTAGRSSAASAIWAESPLGIVASQRLRFRPEGGGPFQFGGVIYADSADKAARFVLDCNQSRLPILFIQDVNGFDVGRDAERTRHHPPRGQARERRQQQHGAQDHADRGPLLRRGTLCPLRQGVRPAVPLRLAGRSLRRDGRPAGRADDARRERRRP